MAGKGFNCKVTWDGEEQFAVLSVFACGSYDRVTTGGIVVLGGSKK